MTQYHKYSYIA